MQNSLCINQKEGVWKSESARILPRYLALFRAFFRVGRMCLT